MGATNSTDPAGMHRLTHQHRLPHGSRDADYWQQHTTFEVPYNMRKDEEIRLDENALWLVAVGSDVALQLERLSGAFPSDEVYVVRAYDGSGNSLGNLGSFRHPTAALAALPTLTTVAHMLYPNHLLMPVDITHVGDVPLKD
jgi:hypothetical protein